MTHPTRSEEELLRHAFRLIGEEAGQPDAPHQPLPHAARRRRLAGALIAAAAVGTVLLTVLLTGDGTGSGSADASSQALSDAEEIACAVQIVEGVILEVRDATAPGERVPVDELPQVTVSLAVKDWIKPAHGPGRLDIKAADPAASGAPPLHKGDRVLFEVWDHPDIDNNYFTGSQLQPKRESVQSALNEGLKSTCPHFWKRRQNDGILQNDGIPGDS